MNKTIAHLQFITDSRPDETLVSQVESVLLHGVRWVQMRIKEATTEERVECGRPLRALCRQHKALFIVNDDIAAARELEADGVHLGLDDEAPQAARALLGSEAIIGGTCNTFEDIVTRHTQGVDYIGLGPLRTTNTKQKLSPLLGHDGYQRIIQQCQETGIATPLIAIGGIRLDDIAPLMAAQLHGIALSSLVIDSRDRAATLSTILENLS